MSNVFQDPSDESDIQVFHIDGGTVRIELTPSELRNEVQNVAHQIVRDCALNKELLTGFHTCMQDWADKNLYNDDSNHNALGSFRSVAAIGRPQTSRLIGFQEGKVKPRSNGTRVKKTYACGKCGKSGHTAPKCRELAKGKRERDDRDDATDATSCPICHKVCKSAQGLSTHVTRKHKDANPASEAEEDN